MKQGTIRTAKQHQASIAEVVRDKKREQILEVAENLFFRRGYAGTTIADIAEKLDVTKPYIYYYFRSKDDIFETLCWQASYACLTSMHFEASDKRSAAEKMREGLHRFATANVTYFKSGTFYYREPGALPAALGRKLRIMARNFYTELCALLEEGRKDGSLVFENTKLTALAVGSIIGFMYTWYKPGGRIGPKEMAEQLTDIMLKTVGAK